jgi:hypothetical protein
MPINSQHFEGERAGQLSMWLRTVDAIAASPVKIAAAFAIGGRLLYSFIAALLAPHLFLDPAYIRSNEFTDHLISQSEGWKYAWLGVWERFDTLWYMHIATSGYDRPNAVVFYPLYPLLIAMSHLPPLFASLLISTICAFFFAWGFQKLVMLDYPAAVGMRGLILYLVWPAGFMLFAGYPDGLLLCCIVWAVYFARMGNATGTAVMALLAGASKALGMVVFLPIMFIAVRTMRWRVLTAGLAAGFAPVAMSIWMRSTGRMPMDQVYSAYWLTTIVPPWQTVWSALIGAAPFAALNLMALLLVVLFAFAFADRIEYSLFAIGILWLVLSKQTHPVLQSTSRYVMVVFPAFINAGRVLESRLRFAVFAGLLGIIGLNVFELFLKWWLVV